MPKLTPAIFAALGFVVLFSGSALAGSKVMFYMHGSDLHGKNETAAELKNYRNVVRALEDKGLEVIFELRNEHAADEQATRTAKMVQDRIASGTAPQDIIVGGYSYGSMITLKASGLINNENVNYALFAGCPEKPSIPVTIDYAKVKGRVFSIVDTGDNKFGLCQGRLPGAPDLTETSITSGKGHKIFKLGKDKFIKQWLAPFAAWAK